MREPLQASGLRGLSVPLSGLVSNSFIAEMEKLAALAPLLPVTLLEPSYA